QVRKNDLRRARVLYEQALAGYDRLGPGEWYGRESYDRATVVGCLTVVAWRMGDYQAAWNYSRMGHRLVGGGPELVDLAARHARGELRDPPVRVEPVEPRHHAPPEHGPAGATAAPAPGAAEHEHEHEHDHEHEASADAGYGPADHHGRLWLETERVAAIWK